MKKALFPVIVIFSFVGLSLASCEMIEDFLSSGDATQALKEALRVGSDTAVSSGSKVNGYFANQAIKILLPEEAQVIVNGVGSIPGIGQPLIDEVVLKLNRAAENAAPQALDILIGAITNITITDAIGIVNGDKDAATVYLRSATEQQISGLFRPHIETSLQTVGAQQAWGQLTGIYNAVPFVDDVNTDLADYTTNKALDGLFHLVAEEEGKIREDPVHQVSDILQKVFGGK